MASPRGDRSSACENVKALPCLPTGGMGIDLHPRNAIEDPYRTGVASVARPAFSWNSFVGERNPSLLHVVAHAHGRAVIGCGAEETTELRPVDVEHRKKLRRVGGTKPGPLQGSGGEVIAVQICRGVPTVRVRDPEPVNLNEAPLRGI